MRIVKPFEFFAIWALSEVASSNSSEVISQSSNNPILEMRKKIRIKFFFPYFDHISTFRTQNLKNLMRFEKLFQFSTIWALSEIASSNSSKVVSQWTSIDGIKKLHARFGGDTYKNTLKTSTSQCFDKCKVQTVFHAQEGYIEY